MKKIITTIFCTIMILCNTGVVAHASEGNVFIFARYDKTITPQPGDSFAISITNGEEEKVIEVDASEAINDKLSVPISSGYYTVTSVEYKGVNDKITSYGSTGSFFLEETEDPYGEILIGVGSESIDFIQDLYEDSVIVNNTSEVETPIEKPITEKPTGENLPEEESPEEKPVDEKPMEENKVEKREVNHFRKLAPIVVMAIIVSAVLWKLRKLGKI